MESNKKLPILTVIHSVRDFDSVYFLCLSHVDIPPRLTVGQGVGTAFTAVPAILVAIDGPTRNTLPASTRLLGHVCKMLNIQRNSAKSTKRHQHSRNKKYSTKYSMKIQRKYMYITDTKMTPISSKDKIMYMYWFTS